MGRWTLGYIIALESTFHELMLDWSTYLRKHLAILFQSSRTQSTVLNMCMGTVVPLLLTRDTYYIIWYAYQGKFLSLMTQLHYTTIYYDIVYSHVCILFIQVGPYYTLMYKVTLTIVYVAKFANIASYIMLWVQICASVCMHVCMQWTFVGTCVATCVGGKPWSF